MKRLTLGLNTIVRVPECWTFFSFGSWLYRRNRFDQWVPERNIRTIVQLNERSNAAKDFIDFRRETQISA